MKKLHKIDLFHWTLLNGRHRRYLPLFYEVFGRDLGTAPVVVVNHALTGNSTVSGDDGWWKELIGSGKTIDTDFLTVVAFNIPGNGYDQKPENLFANYHDFTVRDVALIFWEGLLHLNIPHVYAIIGGSLGGAIAWEMAAIRPQSVEHLIPIATDWKATDWVIANVLTQDQILNNSDDPIADARLHAMLLYRTPESLNERFQRKQLAESSFFHIESWLINHGLKLKNRFTLEAYKLMNHLLRTIDLTRDRNDFLSIAAKIKADIHLVSVNSDYFFTAVENQKTYQILIKVKPNVSYHEIESIHGHDAFLIEFEQLSSFLNPIFNSVKQTQYVSA